MQKKYAKKYAGKYVSKSAECAKQYAKNVFSKEDDIYQQKYAKYVIKYAKSANYVVLEKTCRICTPHFADDIIIIIIMELVNTRCRRKKCRYCRSSLKFCHLSFAERYLSRSDACVSTVCDHLAYSANQIVPDTVLLAINSVFTFSALVVGISARDAQFLAVTLKL